MDYSLILLGLAIFAARVIDVSLGTIRMIAVVQGHIIGAFLLGFIEVAMWVVVVSEVIPKVKQYPLLILFYALGFATGSVLGIVVEKHIALGNVSIRIISPRHGEKIAEKIREWGQPVTIFHGDGMYGPVKLIYVVCKRSALDKVLKTAQEYDPDIFYETEIPKQMRSGVKHRHGFRTWMNPNSKRK